MQIEQKYVYEIASLIFKADDLNENEWDLATIVYDVGDGHTANSGFLYKNDATQPISAGITGDRLSLKTKIFDFRNEILIKTGKKFRQLLIQVENETNRIKIDFEFDDPHRWTITPGKLKEMREALRPKFDSL